MESGVTWSCAALESHSEAWAMAWAAIGGERVSGESSRLRGRPAHRKRREHGSRMPCVSFVQSVPCVDCVFECDYCALLEPGRASSVRTRGTADRDGPPLVFFSI